MNHPRLTTPLFTLLLLGLAAAPAVAETPAPAVAETPAPAEVSVADLGWLAGDWWGESEGSIFEEQWSTVGGGAMMGMFRWFTARDVRLYEFLLIEAGPRGPVLRLKHFNPGLRGWEEKDEALDFHLTELAEGRAVFAMDPEIEDTRLIYETTDEGGLVVRLVKHKGGEENVLEFRCARR